MDSVKRLFLLVVVPLLIAPTEAGCLALSCNCPSSSGVDFFFPAELNVQLAVTGEACQRAPACYQSGDGGGCTQYWVAFTNAGACHLIATAADGRVESGDLSVVGSSAGCCGTRYDVNSTNPVSLTFSQDASMDTGG